MVRNATEEELLTGQPYENQQQFSGGSCSSGSCGCGTGIDEDPFGGSCATDHGGSCGTH